MNGSSTPSAPASTASAPSTTSGASSPEVKTNSPSPSNSPGVPDKGQSATQTPVAPPVKYKIPVDGQEVEVDLDELKRGYGLKKASQARMDEAARKSRAADEFNQAMEIAKTSPKAARQFLTQKGFTPELMQQMAEEMLYEQIQQQQMSPEEQALMERERKIREREEQIEADRQAEAEATYQREYQQNIETLNREILTTLQKTKVPVTEFTVSRTAQFMRENRQYKLGYSTEQIAQLVDEDYKTEIRSYAEGLSGEELLERFGDVVANKIRRADLARIRGGQKGNGAVPPPPAPASVPKVNASETAPQTEKIDIHEYRRRVNARLKD